jgi:predicted PurR-regulated permease PerM
MKHDWLLYAFLSGLCVIFSSEYPTMRVIFGIVVVICMFFEWWEYELWQDIKTLLPKEARKKTTPKIEVINIQSEGVKEK